MVYVSRDMGQALARKRKGKKKAGETGGGGIHKKGRGLLTSGSGLFFWRA